jgi:hypothetical protein
MAPEQFLQLGADARADQFSFAVALFEAIYGHRPFKGKDLPDLMRAAIEGLPELPPALPGLPLQLRKAIARGLSPKPEDRFDDMDALVQQLEGTRAPAIVRAGGGWPRFVLGMLVGGGALAGLFVWLAQKDGGDDEAMPAAAPADEKGVTKQEAEPDEVVAPVPAADGEADEEVLVFPIDLPPASADEPVPSQPGGVVPPAFVETPPSGVRLPGLHDLEEPGTSGAEPAAEPKPPPAEPKPSEGKADPPAEEKPAPAEKPADPGAAEGGDAPQ